MALNRKTFKKTAAAADTNLPSGYFNTVLYTGTGAAQKIGGYINRAAVFPNPSSSTSTGIVSGFAPSDMDTTSYTFSQWINFDDIDDEQYVFSNYLNSSGNYGFYAIKTNNVGNIIIDLFNTSNSNIRITSTALSAGQWYHLALTWNHSTKVMKLYIDGSLDQTSSALSGTVSTNSNGLRYGRADGAAINDLFTGKLDQIRIFNKELSSTEVTTLYEETFASASKTVTDVFSDSSGIALYRLDGNANDTGLVAAGTIVSSNKIIDLNVNSYTSGITIDDSTSNNNDATIVGNVSYNNLLGRGRFDLEGSSDYLKIDASATFNGATDLTLEGWFRPDNLTATDHLFAIYNTSGSNNKLYLRLNDTDGDIDMHAYGSGSASIASLVTSNSSARVQANKWNHIVGVWESGTAMSVYINGVLAGTTASMGNLNTAGTEDLYIGVLKGYIGSYDFDGKVGDIRGYSSALTASEVLQNFNATRYYYAAYDGTATNVTYQDATNFSPDLVWIKKRSSSTNADHMVFDSVRGADKVIISNNSNAQYDGGGTGYQSSFDSNGFSITGNAFVNQASQTFVSWCFNAGTNAAASNTDGTITSTVKANTDAGFSIVKYTATGTTATVGHGLSSAPELIISKTTSAAYDWLVYAAPVGATKQMRLNATTAAATSGFMNNTAPTSSVYTVASGNNLNYANGDVNVAYCFHSVDGIQKVGSYVGNGSTSNMVVTGFEPAWVMIKNTSGGHWVILDNKRYNGDITNVIYPNLSNAEEVSTGINGEYPVRFTANGFELTQITSGYNASNETMIYLAIAADADTTTPTVANSFAPITYTGNGGTQSIDVGFKPDFVWLKGRTGAAESHVLNDTIRGVSNAIYSNTSGAEYNASGLYTTSFDDDGFTVGDNSSGNYGVNGDGINYVAWCWKAGDHDDNLPEINDNGTIDSVVSVNDAAGFSIVKYNGTQASGATVGHGLSSAPEMIIAKRIDNAEDWVVYHSSVGNTKTLNLNNGDAAVTDSAFNNTTPSSTVFTLDNCASGSCINSNSGSYIAYCFTSITGYQKVGSYTGTGVSGRSVTTGFQPRFLMIKGINFGSGYWFILDNQRTSGTNGKLALWANVNLAESSTYDVRLDATGFTLLNTDTHLNQNYDYLYLAIA
ncbi:hypothetical protein [uncultured Mediterranean phage uvMED]|nr:hypothetical protein [uncultured Mediterranean phage uvMED]